MVAVILLRLAHSARRAVSVWFLPAEEVRHVLAPKWIGVWNGDFISHYFRSFVSALGPTLGILVLRRFSFN